MSKNRRVTKILDNYSNNASLRSAINLIPYVGGAIDVLISTNIQKKTFERIERLFKELRQSVEVVDENKIDYQFVNSDEFYDLLLKAMNASAKTRLNEKIKIFSEILSSAMVVEEIGELKHEDVLDLIENLTENDIKHVRILKQFLEISAVEKKRDMGQISINTEQILEKFPDLNSEIVFVGLLRMEHHNLVSRRPNISGIEHSKYYFLATPIFKIITRFLQV